MKAGAAQGTIARQIALHGLRALMLEFQSGDCTRHWFAVETRTPRVVCTHGRKVEGNRMAVVIAAPVRDVGAAFLFSGVGTKAGEITQAQEYAKYVGHCNAVNAFAEFGGRVNLPDGRLWLRATDIELPGKGPTIRLAPTFSPDGLGQYFHETLGNGFSGWELETPRIRTIAVSTGGVSASVGWQVTRANATQKNAAALGSRSPLPAGSRSRQMRRAAVKRTRGGMAITWSTMAAVATDR